jgi:hypothetical protein
MWTFQLNVVCQRYPKPSQVNQVKQFIKKSQQIQYTEHPWLVFIIAKDTSKIRKGKSIGNQTQALQESSMESHRAGFTPTAMSFDNMCKVLSTREAY